MMILRDLRIKKRDIYSENEDQLSMMGIRLLFGSV